MSSSERNTKVTFRWETGSGEVTETFDLKTLTDGPDGRFVFFDTDDEPRVILSAAELADLQQRAGKKVLNDV
jgi:hypothetical protein